MHSTEQNGVGLRRQRRTRALWGFWWAACWTKMSDLMRLAGKLTWVGDDSIAQWSRGSMLTLAGHEALYIDDTGCFDRQWSFSTALVVSDSPAGAIGWIKGFNEWFCAVSAHQLWAPCSRRASQFVQCLLRTPIGNLQSGDDISCSHYSTVGAVPA